MTSLDRLSSSLRLKTIEGLRVLASISSTRSLPTGHSCRDGPSSQDARLILAQQMPDTSGLRLRSGLDVEAQGQMFSCSQLATKVVVSLRPHQIYLAWNLYS